MKDMIRFWETSSVFDSETQQKVKMLQGQDEELLSRFGSELSFGTGGLRGILGEGTNRMNRYTVARATMGLAAYLKGQKAQKVAIAYDSRNGSAIFATVAAGVLAQNGLKTYLYNRLMPTPMLSFAVREMKCDAGIVITASHNPAQYNGYKVYGADGCQITDEVASEITKCIAKTAYQDICWMEDEQARRLELVMDIPQRVYDAFIAHTLACRMQPELPIKLKVVYTPLHGAGLEPIRDVFKQMHMDSVLEVAEQCIPNGDFPTCPKPNPELREALQLGLELAQTEQADLLVATDPDCDRVGVAIRSTGKEYDILTGNEVGLLLLQYILDMRLTTGTMPPHPIVIKTIVTSDLAIPIAQNYGAEVWEVLTGFKYIGEGIGKLEKEGEERQYVFGFEESCGYLSATHVRDKDAVSAVMLIIEMAQHYQTIGKTLRVVLDELYATYGMMMHRLLDYEIEGALPMAKMKRIMTTLRQAPPKQIGDSDIAIVKDYLTGIEGLPKADVLSYDTGKGEKVIIRPSGTEPKVKMYLSTLASDKQEAQAKLNRMTAQVHKWMQ